MLRCQAISYIRVRVTVLAHPCAGLWGTPRFMNHNRHI